MCALPISAVPPAPAAPATPRRAPARGRTDRPPADRLLRSWACSSALPARERTVAQAGRRRERGPLARSPLESGCGEEPVRGDRELARGRAGGAAARPAVGGRCVGAGGEVRGAGGVGGTQLLHTQISRGR